MEHVGRLGQADPCAFADFGLGRAIGCDPKRAAGIEREPVERWADIEGHAKPARAASKIAVGDAATQGAHRIEAGDRFDRADQNRCTDTRLFGGDIQAIRGAVDQVDVHVPRREEHRTVSLCLATVGVGGGVPRRVGLGLDDAADELHTLALADEQLADQEAGEFDGFRRETRARDRLQELGRDGEGDFRFCARLQVGDLDGFARFDARGGEGV